MDLREEDVATSCFVTNYLDDIIQIDEWVMEFVKDITPLTRVSEIDRWIDGYKVPWLQVTTNIGLVFNF